MKPTFALDLSRDMIALLYRTPKGWLPIGDVAFDAPDLDEALDYLRKTALGLSPMGMATKIILPASQILYTEVTAPGPSREDKRRQIGAALEGKTPYAVEDLVFDWSGKGATVKVAVVARETLEEAEGFAVAHRMNPVSFVAIPAQGTFSGEAWFGPTAASATIIANGEKVDRDRDAVVILHREVPPPEPTTAAPIVDGTAPLPGLEEAVNGTSETGQIARPLPEPDAAPEAQLLPESALAPEAQPVPESDPVPEIEAATPTFEADRPAVDHAPAGLAAEDPAEGPVARKSPEGAANAALAIATASELEPLRSDLEGAPVGNALTDDHVDLAAASPMPDPSPTDQGPARFEPALAETRPAPSEPAPSEVEEAPFAHVTDTAAFPEGDEDRAPPLSMAVGDDMPPAPSSAALVAFASRRGPGQNASVRLVDGTSRGEIGPPRPGPSAARVAPGKGFAGLVTAPSIPGTRAKPKLKPVTVAKVITSSPPTARSPARPGGTFGNAAPPRNRSGVVFMVLVALLLVCLALLAAWSSLFLARSEREAAASQVAVEDVPAVDDEMLADMQDPEGMTDPLPEAEGAVLAADPGAQATESLPEPDPAPMNLAEEEASDLPAGTLAAVEAPVAPEPAPETMIATDLVAATLPAEDQDEIFLSSMDAPPPALDALALPVPDPTKDSLPEAPMPPPAFGTVYRFDANGLLMPTPEGILSPDGVLLVAGPPPLVPPARSEAATAAALTAAAAAPTVAPTVPDAPPAIETVVPDPSLAGFKPRARPDGIVPPAPATVDPEDEASLAPGVATAVAALRPLGRPASLVAASAPLPTDPNGGLGAQAASLAAQAEARLAAAAAVEAANPSIVAISMRPAPRPGDLSNAVEAAVAAAIREPEVIEVAAAPPTAARPEELEEAAEPDTAAAAPSIPTKASVAKQATFANAINLSKINLIGTYGTDSKRYALVRKANGRYTKVRVGDKIDGGTVKAITETEVRYQKGGKLVSLAMPKA